MKQLTKKTSRRAFFLQGGAVLGATAGVAVAAASAVADATPGQPQALVDEASDREAIRQLQIAFTALVESQRYEAAAELFADEAQLTLSGVSAVGKPAILALFVDQYHCQKAATMHCGYRRNARQLHDALEVSADGQQAAATFHVEVELGTPLTVDSTVAEMARLQGHFADRRWENGRFDARYVKSAGVWRMATLSYRAAG